MNAKRLLLLLVASLLPASTFAQGSLTPPGAPATTMKTLQQIEPRIDLQNAPTSAVTTSNASYHYIITQPGSYYLSGNISVTKSNGIQINAAGVTLDLNGFEIVRGSGTGGLGIEIGLAAHRARIFNGSVRFFGAGIQSAAVDGETKACAVEDVTVANCSLGGIRLGRGARVDSCRVHDNSGSFGISVDDGSVVSNCTAHQNSVTAAIVAGEGCILNSCTAWGNTGLSAINAGHGSTLLNCSAHDNTVTYALDVGATCTVIGCSARRNQSGATNSAGIRAGLSCSLTNCASSENQSLAGANENRGRGFDLGTYSIIENSVARFNDGAGIRVVSYTIVRQNSFTDNGIEGLGGGIHVVGNLNRIEDNLIAANERGLHITSDRNVVRGNTVRSNSGRNYDIAAGNQLEILLSEIPETFNVAAMVKLSGTLTGDAGAAGITVASDNVTIDLGGHGLVGVATSLDGIVVSGARANVIVRNGVVSDWGGDGIDVFNATNSRIADVEVRSCGANGILAGSRAMIEKAIVRNVSGNGIVTSTVSQVRDSLVFAAADGISGGDVTTIERCVVNNCSLNGIVLSNGCVARENSCDFQNDAGNAGILVSGSRNRVEANNCTRNAANFSVTGSNNVIIRNSSSNPAGGGHFSITGANNTVGPSVNAATVGASNNPHANYEF